jgi:MFS family permease
MTPPDRRTTSDLEARIQQSLSHCWKEGIAAQVMIGIVDYFLVPFALLIGASNQEVGVLVAVPNLVASILQFIAVQAVEWAGGRRRLLLLGFLIQSLFLLPVGLLSYLDISKKVLVLTALITVYKSAGSLMGPAWGSLVSEYLPAHRRGHYFGWRSRILGIAGLVNLCFWGVFLTLFKRGYTAAAGFLVMFAAAGVARLIAMTYMAKMVDLPLQRTRETEFTFWMFLRRFKESNFVKYVFYVSGITFATHLAAPYFSVHMLRGLKFSYMSYMAVSLAPVVTSLIAFPIWGRHADAVGNARILKITGFLIPVIPLLWLMPRTPLPLVAVELFSGFVWGGFNLCATNFIFDAVSPAKRVRCLGYFNFINGVAIFAGTSLGGWLSARLPVYYGLPLLSLFVVSSVMRAVATVSLSRHFREVRAEARPVTSMELFFSVVGIRPIFGRNEEIPALPPKSVIRFAKRVIEIRPSE